MYYWRVFLWRKTLSASYYINTDTSDLEPGSMQFDIPSYDFNPEPPIDIEKGYAITESGHYVEFGSQYDDGEATGDYWIRVIGNSNERTNIEYTEYVVAPIFLEDKLDETLDSGELILKSMPIESRNAFPPKTKFRIERYTRADYTDEPRRWDMLVEHDDVEEYVGAPEICTHRINLIEVSAVAQGMHVDNIALTYELQDVKLNYKTIRQDNTTVGDNFDAVPDGYGTPTHREDEIIDFWTAYNRGEGEYNHRRYFENTYFYRWDRLNGIKQLLRYVNIGTANDISFTVPSLICQGCYGVGFVDLFEMNTVTSVYRTKRLNGQVLEDTKTLIVQKYSGATAFTPNDDTVYHTTSTEAALVKINNLERIFGSSNKNGTEGDSFYANRTTHPVVATASSSYADKKITFKTDYLSDSEIAEGYDYIYTIECKANPTNQSGMLKRYRAYCDDYKTINGNGIPNWDTYGTLTTTLCQAAGVYINGASFYSEDMTEDAEGGPFLMKGVKYSCYDLLQKALLTIDTQIINNDEIGLDGLHSRYPIVLDQEWVTRLKVAKMQETIFEGKNLWEVLLQIGYYLHAIPYLEFADDGTDRFLLSFRQLGGTKEKEDISVKITVFNSRNLSDYFTQYDSYVTNLFSPQNMCEEWVVAKTSDSTYLISNDTAEIRTSRPILEIVAFDITYNNKTVDALQYIFEESVYQVLTSDNPIKIKPAKGNALYYKLGANAIIGLNYVPPQKNSGTYYYSLQEICRRLFGLSKPEELKFNDLVFHIKYRTQDELRISQVRPDIQNFMRNSTYEKYPHHEQYYGQQDKIIDSERFSANLFGQLIRVGNTEYQRQECAAPENEKESGDLVTIDGEPYYVTATENEYYADIILQKVTYSKNFNQISKIVTIPSEPRFYEVSERSKIRREVRLMDFLELTTTKPIKATRPRFISNAKWKNLIKGLIFNKQSYTLPNFAYTKYVADYKRNHTGAYGQYVPNNELFPSSDVIRTAENTVEPKASSDHADCIVSLLYFPLHDGIVFEWDMEDNFKAGDFVDPEISGVNESGEAYLAQQSHRYCDVMGRADLFTFRLFSKSNWTRTQAQQLPKAVTIPSESSCDIYLPSPYLIGLDKDNREAVSFNYQINLLHRPTEVDSEDFFTFPNLFGQKESPLKMCLLSEPQSLFDENINLSPAIILADDLSYNLVDNNSLNAIEVRIPTPNGVNLGAVNAIALYQDSEDGGRYAYIIKNVSKQPDDKKLQSWWLSPVFND